MAQNKTPHFSTPARPKGVVDCFNWSLQVTYEGSFSTLHILFYKNIFSGVGQIGSAQGKISNENPIERIRLKTQNVQHIFKRTI